MKRLNLARQLYHWGPATAALGVVLAAAAWPASWDWSLSTVLALSMWALLVTIAEASPVSLPWSEARLRLSPVFEFGAMLSFGPLPAAIITGVGRFTAALLRSNGPAEGLRAATRAMLMVGVAGAIYRDQGGSFGAGLARPPVPFAPIVMAMAAFAFVDGALRGWRILAEQPGVAMGTLVGDVQKRVVLGLFVLPVGLGFAWLEALAGPVAAACALMPMLLARRFDEEPVVKRAESDSAGGAARLATVRALMSVIDAFDTFSRGHSFRVSKFVVCIGRHLGVPAAELEKLEYAALLHDIGRTAIHLDVLARPRPLDARERSQMQTHPTVGYELVKDMPGMLDVAEIVYAHHEQPDGRGYPRGLKGNQIPLGARIIMVAAAYDAMTCERPYRRGLSQEAACSELRKHSGTQFFPDIVEAFIALLESGELDQEMDERYQPLHTPAPDAQSSESAA